MVSNILLLLHPTIVTEPAKVESIKSQLQSQYNTSEIRQNIIDKFTLDQDDLVPGLFDLVYYLLPVELYLKQIPVPTLIAIFKSLGINGELKGCLPKSSQIDAIMDGFLIEEDKWVKPELKRESVSLLKRKSTQTTSTDKSSGVSQLPTFNRATVLPTFKRLSTVDVAQPFKKLSSPTLTDTSEAEEYDSDSSLKLKESKLTYFDDDEDELLDENELLIENSDNYSFLSKPVIVPMRCEIDNGKKRRKACKDCTCGLKEQEELEDLKQRSVQDTILGNMAQSATLEAIKIEERLKKIQESKKGEAVKFEAKDLNEIDFTIEGKTGGCNSCSLGDLFRCDGCPFLGLPAFKPGQQVTIFEDDI